MSARGARAARGLGAALALSTLAGCPVPVEETRDAREGMAALAPVIGSIEVHEARQGTAPDTLGPLLAERPLPGIGVTDAPRGDRSLVLVERPGRELVRARHDGPTQGGPALSSRLPTRPDFCAWRTPSRAWTCWGAL